MANKLTKQSRKANVKALGTAMDSQAEFMDVMKKVISGEDDFTMMQQLMGIMGEAIFTIKMGEKDAKEVKQTLNQTQEMVAMVIRGQAKMLDHVKTLTERMDNMQQFMLQFQQVTIQERTITATRFGQVVEAMPINVPEVKEVEALPAPQRKEATTSQSSFDVQWKRGRRPGPVVDALEVIHRYSKNSNLDWKGGGDELVRALSICADYEGIDAHIANQIQSSKKYSKLYWHVYLNIARKNGLTYREAIETILNTK